MASHVAAQPSVIITTYEPKIGQHVPSMKIMLKLERHETLRHQNGYTWIPDFQGNGLWYVFNTGVSLVRYSKHDIFHLSTVQCAVNHAARVQVRSKSSGTQRAAQADRRRLASADADEELSSYMEHRLSSSGSRACAPGRACRPAARPCHARGASWVI